jgi:hypothetical protein
MILALSEATRYDVWDRPVVTQMIYTPTCDPVGVLMPLSQGAGLPAVPDWTIELAVPWVEAPKPTTRITGTPRNAPPSSPEAALGKATLVAAWQFAFRAGQFWLPAVIQARRSFDGYEVSFTPLAEPDEGDTTVTLSEDLKWCRIDPDPYETRVWRRQGAGAAGRGGKASAVRLRDLVLKALVAAFEYDIYDGGVIVQTVYIASKEPTVLFLPSHLSWEKWNPPQPDWRIEVRASATDDAGLTVVPGGTLAKLAANSPKQKLRKVMLAAADALQAEGINVSGYRVGVMKYPDWRYGFSCSGVSGVQGGHFSFDFSHDLRRYDFSPGR